MGKVEDFLTPDFEWDTSRWGRIQQGMREMAVLLRKDVAAKDLAWLLQLDASSLTGWKNGSRPSEASMDRLAGLFSGLGLTRYTARYLDYGDELVSDGEKYPSSGAVLRVAESERVYDGDLGSGSYKAAASPRKPRPTAGPSRRKKALPENEPSRKKRGA